MLTLSLEKAEQSAGALRLSLAKKGIVTPPSADVAFVLDVSMSFDDEHRGGLTNDILVRLTPWGLAFDPNGALDVFTFSSGEGSDHHVGTITAADVNDYVRRQIIKKVPRYNGGTEYARVLRKTIEHFGWTSPAKAPAKSGGFLGRMFGGGSSTATAPAPTVGKKSIVLFVTDGRNSDQAETRRVLRESQERGDGIYFLFIGCSNQENEFEFLERIGEEFDNTGLVVVNNIPAFTALSDEALNELLLGDELLMWLKK